MTTFATPAISTPSLSSPGIGSGLNVSSIVQQLVAADTQGQTTLLGNQQSAVQAELSAVGIIKSAASSLNSAITTLSGSGLGQRAVNVSDSAVLSATASSGAPLGTHNVVVTALAQAQQLASQAYTNADTTVGSGTLTLTVGTGSFSLDLSAGATLAQIRDAINGASGNTGVTASLLTANDGTHLMLSANTAGTANAVTVSASGGDGGLAALNYGAGSNAMTQLQAASDAQLTVDGYAVTAGTNTVSTAIQGLTLNLQKAVPGETVTVGISQDTQAISGAVASFVTAYNTLNAAITQETSYDSNSKSAGPLLGDPGISTMSQQLRRIAGSLLSSSGFNNLSQIGITAGTDGSLSVDSTALASALSQNSGAVASLLTGPAGVATQMQSLLTDNLGSNGLFSAQNTAYQSQLQSISDQQSALTDRTSQLTQMYTAQFSALDTLMSQMQATSSYLTQALAALPSLSGSSTTGKTG